MIVVADTSPLNYLILIDQADLLFSLFGEVQIPSVVLQELIDHRTPPKVKRWVERYPTWVILGDPIREIHPSLFQVDAGEQQAIQLALEIQADVILMDDAKGRAAAEALHLDVLGTLGMLERSARLGLCDFRQCLAMLERTTFRLAPRTRDVFLRRNR